MAPVCPRSPRPLGPTWAPRARLGRVPRLTGLDASFLYLETPAMHMHVCFVAVLDPSTMPDAVLVRGGCATTSPSRVPLIPPFGRVLRPVPLQLHHPVWVDDPDFDIDHHVHRGRPRRRRRRPATCTSSATLAGEIAGVPLDRSRPLWDLSVVEGLDDGRLGLVVKVHHSAMDGSAGIEILYALFDLEPDPAPTDRRRPTAEPADAGRPTRATSSCVGQAARDRLRGRGRRRRARPPHRRRHRRHRPRRRSAEDGPGRRHPARRAAARRSTAPSTPAAGLAFARVSLDRRQARSRTRSARRSTTSCSPSAPAPCAATCSTTTPCPRRRCWRRARCRCAPRTRTASSATGCRSCSPACPPTSTTRSSACGPPAPAPRAAKAEQRQLGASLLQRLGRGRRSPVAVAGSPTSSRRFRLADRLPPVHNVVVSNVAGPAFPVYLAGARLEQGYPMGPVLEGAGLNITVLSYRRHRRHRVHGLAQPGARPVGPGRRRRAGLRRAGRARLTASDRTRRSDARVRPQLSACLQRVLLAPMAYNIADLFEHTVDVIPDQVGADLRRRDPDLRRARGAGQPPRPPPAGRRASSPATTSASTRPTASSGSRPCSPSSRSGPCRSTSTTATSRTSCATCSTTPTSSASSTARSSAPGSPPSSTSCRS